MEIQQAQEKNQEKAIIGGYVFFTFLMTLASRKNVFDKRKSLNM